MKNSTKAYTCIQSLKSLGITKLLTAPIEEHLTQTTSKTKTQIQSTAGRIITHSKIPLHTPSGKNTQRNYIKKNLEPDIMDCESK